jgi:hypothetical protein
MKGYIFFFLLILIENRAMRYTVMKVYQITSQQFHYSAGPVSVVISVMVAQPANCLVYAPTLPGREASL